MPPRTLSRQDAIDALRSALLRLTDEHHSACQVAGRLGIFCKGHRGLDDFALFERYDWIVARQKPKDRPELEDLANRWELARQTATGAALACDVQQVEQETCLGWDEFDNETLARHYFQLLEEPVFVR
ncbi:MAG: hypothetical protein U1E65_27765 [Myxococcota bacterium]